eukprot:TRINITY_DN1087_c1_g1_i1.p1 TRINITY_DN1087_c1_g1~~TRINITY_DN1087_c1_g1_i1.p1  ORF type:complete len:478 (-),score=41.63 TRINITY_DN1087_c1_g1_i1:1229-2620(-)
MYAELVRQRESGLVSQQGFRNNISNSQYGMAKHLKIEKVLQPTHNGCVNTIKFSEDGQLLISGSDDLNLHIYNVLSGELITQIETEHTNNIFGAFIMPYDNNSHIVSCAADGYVYLTILGQSGEVKVSKQLGHQERVHNLTLDPSSRSCLYSAGEDGSVCQYDIRCPDHCWYIIDHSDINDHFCLFSISVNPRMPQELALGGDKWWVPVYDVRKNLLRRDGDSIGVLGSPVHFYYPNQVAENDDVRVSSVQWSQYGHLLASYNDEDIYLFDPQSKSADDCRIRQQIWQKTQTQEDSADDSDPDSSQSSIDEDPELHKEIDDSNWSQVVQKFSLHRNHRTIKQVNFCGSNDEYVMSGSDCGNLFVWDVKSGNLVFYEKGDNHILNFIEQHPHIPFMLATSGIEHCVKIWQPTRNKPKDIQLQEMRDLYGYNQFQTGIPMTIEMSAEEFAAFWRDEFNVRGCAQQ